MAEMVFLSYLIICLHIFSITFARKPIPLGAIFHEDNYDEEIAFRDILLRENMNNTRLEFIPVVRKVDRGDTFQAERIACELASEGVAAIFGPSSFQTSKIVGSICNELGIPHIVAHWIPGEEKSSFEHHQYTRNLFPENNLYADVLSKIIDDYEWKGFTLIYDTNESLERLQDVLEKHGPEDDPVTFRQLPDDDDYQPLLKKIQNAGESHIIVDCSPDKVMKIFQQAIGVKMMQEYQNYIVTSLDSHTLDFSELRLVRANITTIRLMNPLSYEVTTPVNYWRMHAIREKAYSQIYADRIKTETALFHDAVKIFVTSFRELNALRDINPMALRCTQTNKWPQGIQVIKNLNQKTDEGMTGRIVFNDAGQRTDFYMEILELNQEGLIKIATLDPMTRNISYTRSEAEVYSQVTQSLQNKTVIVVAKLGPPYVLMKPRAEGEYLEGNDRFEGYAVDLIDGIAKILGFQYKFELVPDGKYGSYDPKTKKWNGLVKYLLDRKADLAICDLTITYERRTAVDFTMPFMTLGISILYAKPLKEPPGLFSFMHPLSLSVWLLMATAYLCISVLLFFLAKTAADDWENPHPCNTDPEELETIWNMHNCIWLTAGSIMQQGCDILPKAISTRITAGLWWFFALIVISSYTANLAAFLTMERMDVSIENAEDLAKQSKIKYGAVTGGSTLSFFKESNFSTYQRMWAVMESTEPSVFAANNEEGIERVVKGNRMYAFLMESTSIEYIVERNCNLTQVGGLLDSKGYGIAMPVNSPYRTHISQTVLKMQEEGKLYRLKTRWWKEKNKETSCDEGTEGAGDDAPELKMANVGGVFLVLVGGLGIAIIIGILEFLWNVSNVSIAEKVTRWEAFKAELLFAVDVRITTKPVHKSSSEKSQSISNISSKILEVDPPAIVPGWRYNLDEKPRIKV